jgi:hypothetical protein
MCVPDHHMGGASRASVPEFTNCCEEYGERFVDELLVNCQVSRISDRLLQNVTSTYPAERKPGRRLGDNIKMGKEVRHY